MVICGVSRVSVDGLYKKKAERLFTRFFKATNINSWHSVRSEKEGISRMLISERLKLDVTVKPKDTHDS